MQFWIYWSLYHYHITFTCRATLLKALWYRDGGCAPSAEPLTCNAASVEAMCIEESGWKNIFTKHRIDAIYRVWGKTKHFFLLLVPEALTNRSWLGLAARVAGPTVGALIGDWWWLGFVLQDGFAERCKGRPSGGNLERQRCAGQKKSVLFFPVFPNFASGMR
jgi:hypothetical protein